MCHKFTNLYWRFVAVALFSGHFRTSNMAILPTGYLVGSTYQLYLPGSLQWYLWRHYVMQTLLNNSSSELEQTASSMLAIKLLGSYLKAT